jgi:hypothetical protein
MKINVVRALGVFSAIQRAEDSFYRFTRLQSNFAFSQMSPQRYSYSGRRRFLSRRDCRSLSRRDMRTQPKVLTQRR